jgi:hypothetical protein
MREIRWALELIARPELSGEKAAAVWFETKRRLVETDLETRIPLGRLRDALAGKWREITGILVQDSLAPSAAVRSAGVAAPKLLVFETPDFLISLSFSGRPEAQRLEIIGQIAPRTADHLPPGGRIEVWSDSETNFGEINDRGEFALEEVPRGDLHIDILMGGDSIQLSPIHTRTVQLLED